MSETNLLLCQWLCVEVVWGISNSLYCCLSRAAVITLNHSVIGLVAAFFHSAIQRGMVWISTIFSLYSRYIIAAQIEQACSHCSLVITMLYINCAKVTRSLINNNSTLAAPT